MQLIEKRLQFYTLKTGLTQLELQKQKVIKAQQYDKAADLRDQQRKYLEKLTELRNSVLEMFNACGTNFSEINQKQEFFKFLIEMDPFDNGFLDPLEESLKNAKKEYREAQDEKKQRMEELHQQRLELLSKGDQEALREVMDSIRDLNEELGNGRTINFPEDRD